MGITLAKLDALRSAGLLSPGARVLDIGSSNLYSAEPEAIRRFIGNGTDDATVKRLADGSSYGANGGKNESFVGELLECAGLDYLSFDIANGYRTRIFDLNIETLPEDLSRSFDIVLNFGTTEHIVNQHNAMRVIHDACKVGGHIVHEVPALGFIDHGYFTYTPRFFFDLAGWNEYQVIDFAYRGPAPGKPISSIVSDYATYFPVLANCQRWDYQADNIALYIAFRKIKDAPFRLPLERSTSVVREPVGHQPSLVATSAQHRHWLNRFRHLYGSWRRLRALGLSERNSRQSRAKSRGNC